MKHSKHTIIYFAILAASACIDPLEIDTHSSEKQLIIDGLISDQPGPYQVKLYYSNKLKTALLVPFEPVSNAEVSITDNLGGNILLAESKPGLYETPASFVGQVGLSYYLSITNESGKKYKSSSQVLSNSGSIGEINLRFEKNELPGNSQGELLDALSLSADFIGENGTDNLYRWRWLTIFKAKSSPELRTEPTPGGGERPDPEPCSGYIYTGGRLVQIGQCTCCVCWSYNYSTVIKVSKNELVSDFQFRGQELGKIPVTPMHFYDRYYLEVQQLTLTKEAYAYWDLVQKQQNGSTNIFQPAAIKIKGNITCITDANEVALGFFEVAGMVSKSFYIDKSIIPEPMAEIEIVPYSCEDYFFKATTTKPLFW